MQELEKAKENERLAQKEKEEEYKRQMLDLAEKDKLNRTQKD